VYDIVMLLSHKFIVYWPFIQSAAFLLHLSRTRVLYLVILQHANHSFANAAFALWMNRS